MTVAEFITLWDSVNSSTIHIKYYYNNKFIFKHELYNIKEELTDINIRCSQDPLNHYHITINHEDIEHLNYDQEQFYNELFLDIPDNTFITTLHIFIN